VIGETLVVMIENDSESYSLGLDVKTGRNLWKLERPKAPNWTSPLLLRGSDGANPLVLLQSSKGLHAVDPVSGSRVWEYAEGASTTSSGVVAGGTVYVASSGITALKPPPSGGTPEQLWRSKQTNPATISPLILGDRLYSINGAGVLAVIDLKAGDNQWKLRLTGPFSASPVAAGTRLLAVSEKGLVQIVDTAAPQGALLGQLQLPMKTESKEMLLSTPSISGPHIFVRSDSTLWRLGK
jgi:outer membrane protein assembly factor BamB